MKNLKFLSQLSEETNRTRSATAALDIPGELEAEGSNSSKSSEGEGGGSAKSPEREEAITEAQQWSSPGIDIFKYAEAKINIVISLWKLSQYINIHLNTIWQIYLCNDFLCARRYARILKVISSVRL